jgi:hypothetical protein
VLHGGGGRVQRTRCVVMCGVVRGVAGGLGPLRLRVSGSRRSRPAALVLRHAPACSSSDRASDQGGSEAVSTRDAHRHAPTRLPSLQSRPFAARLGHPPGVAASFVPVECPRPMGTSMPNLSGAERVRTWSAGSPKPLACWLPCLGRVPLKDGLADRSLVPLRPLPCGARAAQFASRERLSFWGRRRHAGRGRGV